ncbi:transposase [Tunturiibacter lichenicola]|uniref:transposase n=1 Tax=Tunturiibacter lichenicola TaxID=2051959 RepID=UPI0036F3782D
MQLLAELSTLPSDLTVREWVAHSGLDPAHEVSGNSVRKASRISRAGNRHLRRAPYMPALVASRCDPHAKAFFRKPAGSKEGPPTGAHCGGEEVAARHIWDISEWPEVRGSKAVSNDHVVLTSEAFVVINRSG